MEASVVASVEASVGASELGTRTGHRGRIVVALQDSRQESGKKNYQNFNRFMILIHLNLCFLH